MAFCGTLPADGYFPEFSTFFDPLSDVQLSALTAGPDGASFYVAGRAGGSAFAAKVGGDGEIVYSRTVSGSGEDVA